MLLEHGMVICDALYAWATRAHGRAPRLATAPAVTAKPALLALLWVSPACVTRGAAAR